MANRVAEIQEGILSESWRFVLGIEYPADCASRGISVDELLEKKEWWHGPAWLTEPVIPRFSCTQDESIEAAVLAEQRNKVVLTTQVNTEERHNTIFLRFSWLT